MSKKESDGGCGLIAVATLIVLAILAFECIGLGHRYIDALNNQQHSWGAK